MRAEKTGLWRKRRRAEKEDSGRDDRSQEPAGADGKESFTLGLWDTEPLQG